MSNDYVIYEPTYTNRQKDIREHRFYIDDIIHKLIEMRQDGYRYASLDIIDDFEDNDGVIYAYMSFTAEDTGGYGGVDYECIAEVPIEEIVEYAEQGKPQPPYRQSIEFIKHKND